MSDIITDRAVVIHERLSQRLLDLQTTVAAAAKLAPNLPASPLLRFSVAALLREIYRLLSREPGARALPRLQRRQRPTPLDLAAMLADAKLALETFAFTHRDYRGLFDGGWLTRECFLEAAGQ